MNWDFTGVILETMRSVPIALEDMANQVTVELVFRVWAFVVWGFIWYHIGKYRGRKENPKLLPDHVYGMLRSRRREAQQIINLDVTTSNQETAGRPK